MKLSQRLALGYIRTKFKLLASISKKKAAEMAFELFCTPQRRVKKELPKIFQQAEPLHFTIDGVRVRGWRWNKGGSKRVLILHGFESSSINFYRYVIPLMKKGYEVFAFDAPAHGKSGGRQINAPLYKRTILEIIQQYGPVKSFIAHSFGGLALSIALEEKRHDSDYRVALIAPATETTTAINSFFKFLQLDSSVRPYFDNIILQKSDLDPGWFSVKRAMKNIRAKVLWIHDEDDEITPVSDAKKVKAENYPNIEFVFTKGLGHRRIYRENKIVKMIVDFL